MKEDLSTDSSSISGQKSKISAIMALYNTPHELLNATVKSILAQTFTDFELIIIDDASTIEYKDFFEKFSDNRIKYFKLEKNAGPGHARNEGIRRAEGQYIAIVDSDDVYLPQRFGVQSDFLDKNSDISLISSAFKQSNNGKIPEVIENHQDIKIFMLFNSAFANPAVMFRKKVFIEKNLFYPENINFGEDYGLWLDAMFAEVKMANLKDVLMVYTRRKGQLSKEKSDIQNSILKDFYKKILSNMGLNPLQEDLQLHYNIDIQKFDSITSEQIQNWFDEIIQANKNSKIFDEQKLIDKKDQTLNKFENFKKRILKIKIGQHNFCINKPLKIYIEKRD